MKTWGRTENNCWRGPPCSPTFSSLFSTSNQPLLQDALNWLWSHQKFPYISTSRVPKNFFVWALVMLQIVTILSPNALVCFDFLRPVSQQWRRGQPGLQWTAKTTSTDTNHRGLNFKKSCLGNSNLIYLLLRQILLNWRKNFKPNYRL